MLFKITGIIINKILNYSETELNNLIGLTNDLKS